MTDSLVWDFNGTLLNDVQADLLCANDLLRSHGLPLLADVAAYRDVFRFPVIEYYRDLGFDFDQISFRDLAHEWLGYYEKHNSDMKLMPGALEVLSFVRDRGIKQYVISASEQSVLKDQLAKLGVSDYFVEIIGIDNVYAGSKKEIAAQWLQNADRGNILMVGDTLHDHEVAQAIGARCLLFTGGHQSRQKLESAGVPVIDDLKKTVEYL